ncbi:MAG TPA: hypothetical protein VHE78_19460 [Gemmatimonadaceae bacterium]|nr:hypothetical protein [Gemmatimonadaceae bacterium]
MMDETELRRRFAQLREADRAGAPSFTQIFERVRARPSWRATLRVRPLAIGAAAAVVVAAVWVARGRSFSPSGSSPTITTWSAPTDALLRTPGSELLGAMPALGASVLDTMIPTRSSKGA